MPSTFFKQEVYAEAPLVSLKAGNGILCVTLGALVFYDELTGAVTAEEILQDGLGDTLAVKVLLVRQNQLNGAVQVFGEPGSAS
ncbi:MAG: hypothetical protein MZV63_18425 [Marinilabiliales bacterium]|nr:hypothetical protein [Marinilabiliales bacterium]